MNLDHIIPQVIETILRPVADDSAKSQPSLCYTHDDPAVRSIIHSMLRMAACTSSRGHIISPCYRSNDPVECKNHYCPYVIGHAIYLWVAMKLGTIRRGEEIGVGCTYKHEGVIDDEETKPTPQERPQATQLNKHAYEIRREVFSFLEGKYGEMHHLRLPPILAMNRVRAYYEEVIRPLLNSGSAPTIGIPSRDIVSGDVGYATVYKSDDNIFAARPVNAAVVESDPPKPALSNTELFPSLTSLGERESCGIRSCKEVPRRSLYRSKGSDL